MLCEGWARCQGKETGEDRTSLFDITEDASAILQKQQWPRWRWAGTGLPGAVGLLSLEEDTLLLAVIPIPICRQMAVHSPVL